MKTLIKLILIIVFVSMISGCMDTVSYYWNNGIPMSKKREQAYRECKEEVRMLDPDMAKVEKTQVELSEFLHRLTPCLERKGY